MRKRTRKRNKKKVDKFEWSYIMGMKHAKKVLTVVIFLVVICFFSIIFAVANTTNTNIINGVYINNIDVSNMSKQEIKEQFDAVLNKKKFDGVSITYNDNEYVLELALLDIENNLLQVLDEANKLGRSGNIVKDNYEIIKTFLFKKNYDLSLSYNEENLDKELNWIYNELPDKYQELDYYIEDSELILSKPVTGVIIEEDAMIGKVESYLNDYNSTSISIPLEYKMKSADEVNVEELHKEIFVEAQDAYYVEEPFKIYPEVNGVDFKNSIDKVGEILNQVSEDNEYVIPLKITKPKTTLKNLSVDAFPNVLGKADGVYDVTNYNRANNLTIAGKKINEFVLAPGETFSYNKVLGARTVEAGYKEAAIYVGGQVVDGLGGGICQISTILYNAVLKANLDIVERKCHQFLPGYAKPGLDATVAYGSIDFKFKNNRNYPIKISSSIIAGVVQIEILGIKEDSDVTVVLENNVKKIIPFETRYITNTKLEAGSSVKVQNGADGKVVETYKVTKKGEQEISRELISVDKYDALTEIIEENN